VKAKAPAVRRLGNLESMYVSFIYPGALLLLLLLIPLWVLALVAPRRLGRGRFWTSLVVRTVLLVALIGSIAGTQLVRRVDELTTVFLVDSSDSVGPEARARAEQWVRDALQTMPDDDRAAIVVFGENALVERAPSPEKGLRRLLSVPVAARTDLGEAISLGLAMLPADTQKRIVLLSDGGENAGDVRTATELAAARGVPIEVVSLDQDEANDVVQLSDLQAPSTVRKGQTINLEVVVESTVAGPATLRILAGSEVLDEQRVELRTGRQTFSYPVQANVDGFVRYEAEIVADNDSRAQNNVAAALVDIQGEPRVLLVEGTEGDADNLAGALSAARMNPVVVTPQAMPVALADLGGYDAVVLLNVHAGAIPARAMETLPAYVRELGRGLIMIGGERTFGVGGWGKTPVEAALPVDMEVKDKQRRPDIAIVFVIDKSGSMAACHCAGTNMGNDRLAGGAQKVDIAKEAVIQASALLQPDDKLGVIAFDNAPHWAIETQQVPSLDTIQEAIAPIAPDGQTNVRGGLLAAKESLERTDAKVKHVILLTDGWSSGPDNLDIANELRDEGITLSTIAAGAGSAPYLEQLAEAGAGRYYPAALMEDVPQIFVEETIKTIGSFIIEQPFVPTLVGDSPIMRGVGDAGWPTLYGYNGTQLKNAAREVLRSPDGDPVLAQWQYGLGRSVAWTSDAKGKWGRDLVRWEEWGKFAAQLVGWTVPPEDTGALAAQARVEGTQAIISTQLEDAAGQPRTDATVLATIVGPDGTAQPVTLRQVAPGQYQATLPSPITGSYLVEVAAASGSEALGRTTVGLVVPYSPEYRQRSGNTALLELIAQQTGGSVVSSPSAAFNHNLDAVTRAQEIAFPLLLLAALLLPFDIGVRRLGLRRRDFAAAGLTVMGRIRRPAAPDAPPVLGELQRAKLRAQARHTRATTPVEPAAAPEPIVASRRAAPVVERPSAEETRRAVEEPAAPSPSADDDPMARLRAAKARAKRR
jgi:Mg-chelatase subunit ChlD